MALTQVIRFLENGDTSSISHKMFNQSPEDKYPTFSICLRGPEIYWNHEDGLFKDWSVTSEQYVKMLKGNGWRYAFDSSNLLYRHESFNFDDVVKHPSYSKNLNLIPLYPWDIITGVRLRAQDVNDSTYYGSNIIAKGTRIQNIPFYVGMRTQDTICFTRNSEDKRDLIRRDDLLSMNNILLEPGSHLSLDFRIIFHYPGQLIRNFHKPSYRSSLASYERDKVLDLTLYHVTKFINRPDSNIRCYAGNKSDDRIFIEELIKHIGCIPIYWKNHFTITRNKTICNSREQLRLADFHLRFFEEYLSSYDYPCVDMKTMAKYSREQSQQKTDFLIKIVYQDRVFKEIKNENAFTFEPFWSSLGGFLGIFLGYSVLQIPDLITNFSIFIRSSRRHKTMSKYILFTNIDVYHGGIRIVLILQCYCI